MAGLEYTVETVHTMWSGDLHNIVQVLPMFSHMEEFGVQAIMHHSDNAHFRVVLEEGKPHHGFDEDMVGIKAGRWPEYSLDTVLYLLAEEGLIPWGIYYIDATW
jgi:hypothetical protein